MRRGLSNLSKLIIAITLPVLVALVVCTMHLKDKEQEIEPMLAVNDVIVESDSTDEIESTTEEVEGLGDIEAKASEPSQQDIVYTDEATASLYSSRSMVEPYDIIATDIELLKGKDAQTVQKYFGESDVFTPDTVSDRLTATLVSFVSNEQVDDNKVKVLVHICTLDYDKMKEASTNIKTEIQTDETVENVDEATKIEVAKGVVKGEYDLHYTIPVIVENGEVQVSEQFKQAITGNWYHGINTELVQVDCPLNN